MTWKVITACLIVVVTLLTCFIVSIYVVFGQTIRRDIRQRRIQRQRKRQRELFYKIVGLNLQIECSM